METSRREKAGLIALVLLTALIVVSCVQAKTPPSSGITFKEAPGAVAVSPAPAAPVPIAEGVVAAPVAGVPASNSPPVADIVIHVTGAVKKPGVYHLSPGARGDDALKAAGGPTSDANPDALNLAAHLEDGSQIHVPTRKERSVQIPPPPDSYIKRDPTNTAKSDKTAGSKTGAAHSALHGGRGGSNGGAKLKPNSGVKININTADAQALQKLPGIGPSMAERILDYRKSNGGFKSPEELMEVSGIGPKKFAKMESLVKVK